jgi:hypothetical protein
LLVDVEECDALAVGRGLVGVVEEHLAADGRGTQAWVLSIEVPDRRLTALNALIQMELECWDEH